MRRFPDFRKHKLPLNLPTNPAYRFWNKDKIAAFVKDQAFFKKYVTVADKYQVTRDTVLIYSFKSHPLLGKYKSCIFDLKLGIVLYKRSPSAIIYHLVVHNAFPSFMIQRNLRDYLHIHRYYMIVVGYNVFFASHGFFTKKCDWISLQFVDSYQHQTTGRRGKFSLADFTFITLPLNGITYQFQFTNCTANLARYLVQALNVYDFIQESLYEAEFAPTYLWYARHSILDDPGEHGYIDPKPVTPSELTQASFKRFTKTASETYAEHMHIDYAFHTDFYNTVYKKITKAYL